MPCLGAPGGLRRWRGSSGFTLVEVLVVLAITGMLAAVCVPRLRLDDGTRLRGAMVALRSDLRVARSTAKRSGETQALAPTKDGYVVRPMGVERALPRGFGLTVDAPGVDPASSEREIRFYPDGASNGGGLTIRHDDLSASLAVRGFDGGLVRAIER